MAFPYYNRGKPDGSAHGEKIEALDLSGTDDPEDYECSEQLSHAVNAALILGRPLLVTGEPGTGKTQLAYSIAYALKLTDPASEPTRPPVPRVLKFETKSTSQARDLFYTYDAVRAFKTDDADLDQRDFIEYQALGKAILEAFNKGEADGAFLQSFLSDADLEKHHGPRRSVVLIDEVDKAPRDFPNDLLNEIDRMYFRAPELGRASTPGADAGDRQSGVPAQYRPIIILTSNSEKALPEPFLRRCVYHHIEFPNEDTIRKIVYNRLPRVAGGAFLEQALEVFWAMRGRKGGPILNKPPSTAELLDWLQVIGAAWATRAAGDTDPTDLFLETLPALVKYQDDQSKARRFLRPDVQDEPG